MALATTCPQCKTSFRVVPDQLKLRRGFVRCGRCRNVFAGIDHLRYVDEGQLRAEAQARAAEAAAEAPPEALGGAGGEGAVRDIDAALDVDAVVDSDAVRDGEAVLDAETAHDGEAAPDTGTAAEAISGSEAAFDGEAASRSEAASHTDAASDFDAASYAGAPSDIDALPDTEAAPGLGDDRIPHEPLGAGEDVEYVVVGTPDPDPLAYEAFVADEHARADEAARLEGVHDEGSGRDDVQHGPDEGPAYLERFASQAPAEPQGAAAARLAPSEVFGDYAEDESAIDYFSTRRSRGFADRRGIALAFVALALALALALQFVVAQRATIAARAPALAPLLGAALAPFGLSTGAPRDLDALTIESFELQASADPDVLEMRALLRNRADHPVRWPSMQLTLTDRSDRVLVRRTLDPHDYLRETEATPGGGVPAQTEWPLHLALEARDLNLAGYDYRVRLFYP